MGRIKGEMASFSFDFANIKVSNGFSICLTGQGYGEIMLELGEERGNLAIVKD